MAIRRNQGEPIPPMEVPVLAFIVVAAGGLLWLRPRPALYALGLLCVLLAFVAFWLESPATGLWLQTRLLQAPVAPGFQPHVAVGLAVAYLLFPLAWHLLAASVTSWRTGLASYLVAGVGLLLVLVGSVWTSTVGAADSLPTASAPSLVFTVIFLPFWPRHLLAMLGLFGAAAFP
jgi:hypothetical protein